jgi:hypothetical protein
VTVPVSLYIFCFCKQLPIKDKNRKVVLPATTIIGEMLAPGGLLKIPAQKDMCFQQSNRLKDYRPI